MNFLVNGAELGPRLGSRLAATALVLLAAVPAAAQGGKPTAKPTPATAPQPAVPQGPGGDGTTRARVALDRHSEGTSRRAFSACDADRDDRLDLFEIAEALDSVDGPSDAKSFARLDTDRDGYVGWPEFDAHFRFVIERGKALVIRPARAMPAETESTNAPAATPLQRFFRLYDANRNGGLDPNEIDRLALQLGLLPMIAASLRNLDADRSGKVEEGELAPWFDQIQKLVPGITQLGGESTANPTSSLGAPWGLDDLDDDGTLNGDEFLRALRRLDAGLAKWATTVFARLDKNKDNRLDATELGRGKRPQS
jgi:hypothetical protein